MSTQLDLVPVKPTTAIVGAATARKSGRATWFRLLLNDRVAACAAAVLALVLLTALFGPMLMGHVATSIDLDNSIRRRSRWRTAGPTCSAPTHWAAACWPG